MTTASVGDRRRQRGERTRSAVLARAAALASAEGLEALTIGRLATDLGMSKSGLFAHFGSKSELQLGVVEWARELFTAEVVVPALRAPRGLPRLRALSDAWLGYAERQVFPGGCFFAAAAAEFDGRPGPVRDRVAEALREWRGFLADAVVRARDRGEIDPGVDAGQLAFEIDALVHAANTDFQLHGDGAAFERARRAIAERLETASRQPRPQGVAPPR